MRESVYEVMGSVGLILLLAGALVVLFDVWYDIVSGLSLYLLIFVMFSAFVLIRVAHKKLKDSLPSCLYLKGSEDLADSVR